MTRGRLVVHGHFYQPSRIDPFSGAVLPDPAAAPFPDWNTRIAAECYRPNAERGNPDRMSFDLGPTLAAWLAKHDPEAYAGFVGAGAAPNAMAQPYHHTILPLASAADRRTEIRWGLRDFAHRFGRRARGMWLPETAVDLATLRLLAAEGIDHTILAPWQGADAQLDPRIPRRVDLGDGRSMTVVFYDTGLSTALSFDPRASDDADRFARERISPMLDGTRGTHGTNGISPIAVIATDGELYGHHQPFRDLFLERLLAAAGGDAGRSFEVMGLAAALDQATRDSLPTISIVERTSWSCHHGILRWSGECPDAPDGRWKSPLRAAFERLAAAIDATVEREFGALPGRPDPWDSRDAYVDVVIGATSAESFAAEWLAAGSAGDDRARFLTLLEATRWRLAMFASDGWFWDDPMRIETRQCLRAAARAARLVDGLTNTHLERRLVHDLALFDSPASGLDGMAIYVHALDEIGQPAPREIQGAMNPSARGLRATG